MLGEVGWFPQDHARAFYMTKGCVGIVATTLVLIHMTSTWDRVTRWGQRLRYLSLLAFTALVTFASAEQVNVSETVDWRNLGGMAAVLLVIVAMAVSIRDDLRKP